MSGQAVKHSIAEVVSSTMAGYIIAVAIQVVVYPYYGIKAHITDDMQIALIFTVISIIRGYVFRRVWNHFQERGL